MENVNDTHLNIELLYSLIKTAQGVGPSDAIKKAIKSAIKANCTLKLVENSGEITGSGFHIGDGNILTCAHVASKKHIGHDDAYRLTVTFDGKTFLKGKIIVSDDEIDVALIVCPEARELPYVEMGDSNYIETGDLIAVISSPEGWHDTATVGRVTNTDQHLGDDAPSEAWNDMIFTDADILEGSSGGEVIGVDGKVYGIVMGITGYNAEEGIGQHAIIPINKAKQMLSPLTK